MATKKTNKQPADTIKFGAFTFDKPAGYVAHARAGTLDAEEKRRLAKGRPTLLMISALRQLAAFIIANPNKLRIDDAYDAATLTAMADRLEADATFENDLNTLSNYLQEMRLLNKHDAATALSKLLAQVKVQVRDDSTLADQLSDLINLNKRS